MARITQKMDCYTSNRRKRVLCAGVHTVSSARSILPVVHDTRFSETGTNMNPTKLIAIVLIVAGSLGLAYGGFSYTKETTGMKLGPIELKVQEKEDVKVPLIVSAGKRALRVA